MGPRACVFDQRGERCYVLCEISSAVMTFSYMDGRLEFLQAVPSVAEPGGVPNSGADLHLAPDGRFLYVSNRGQDSITVFSVQADGTLQLVQALGCGGTSCSQPQKPLVYGERGNMAGCGAKTAKACAADG